MKKLHNLFILSSLVVTSVFLSFDLHCMHNIHRKSYKRRFQKKNSQKVLERGRYRTNPRIKKGEVARQIKATKRKQRAALGILGRNTNILKKIRRGNRRRKKSSAKKQRLYTKKTHLEQTNLRTNVLARILLFFCMLPMVVTRNNYDFYRDNYSSAYSLKDFDGGRYCDSEGECYNVIDGIAIRCFLGNGTVFGCKTLKGINAFVADQNEQITQRERLMEEKRERAIREIKEIVGTHPDASCKSTISHESNSHVTVGAGPVVIQVIGNKFNFSFQKFALKLRDLSLSINDLIINFYRGVTQCLEAMSLFFEKYVQFLKNLQKLSRKTQQSTNHKTPSETIPETPLQEKSPADTAL